MHVPPHSNQARTACERCRQLKLRCSLQIPAESACARCARLSLHCQPGSQRKVGRPSKKEVKKRQIEHSRVPNFDAGPVVCSTDFRFLDNLPRETVNMDWPTPVATPFQFDPFEDLVLPLDCFPIMRELEPPHSDQALLTMTPSKMQVDTVSSVPFEALSRVNVELHDLCNIIFQHAVGMDFHTFSCFTFGDFGGMKAFGDIMRISQDYLQAVRALHKIVGGRATSSATPSSSIALTASFDDLSPGCCEPTRTGPDQDQPPAGTPTLDTPTAYLLISGFVQLVRLLEFIGTILHAKIASANLEAFPPAAANMAFADVAIVDFPTQALLAIELTQYTIRQIRLLLGLPGLGSRIPLSTGLLSTPKYREMLNKELGAVENLWTTRPARLTKLLGETKEVLLQRSTGEYQ